MYVCVYTWIHSIYVFMHVCMSECMYVCVHVCIYMKTYLHTRKHTYMNTYQYCISYFICQYYNKICLSHFKIVISFLRCQIFAGSLFLNVWSRMLKCALRVVGHFVYGTFCQRVILSTCHFVNVPFCQLVMSTYTKLLSIKATKGQDLSRL
jgi:hypothetical protein